MLFETEAEPTLASVTLSRRVESMPALPIEADGPLGEAFLAKGCIDFHDAVRLVRDMPWGRPSRPDALAVIEGGVGAATDKHFLLASLARELGNTELKLVLGIYRMSAETHPAAAGVLSKAGLQSLPEAMVWLRWYGGDYDFSSMRAGARAVVVLQEEVITLDKLPGYVEQRHKDFLVRFLLSSRRDDLPDLKGLWALRQQALDAVIAEQEAHRQAELQRALDIASAQEQMRQQALTDAERAAEEAQNEIRARAAAEAERRAQYEAAEAERAAKAAERERLRAARGDDGESTGRRRTRRAPGQRGAPEVIEEEEELEEETSVRRTTRRAPKGALVEDSGPKRKRTRRAPGQASADEPDEVEEAEETEEEAAPKPALKRKKTRRSPAARLAAEDEAKAEAVAASEAEPEPKQAAGSPPDEDDPGAAVAPTIAGVESGAKPRRKATRKAPGARRPAAEPEDDGKAEAELAAAKAAAARVEAAQAKAEPEADEAPKPAPKRKRTRKPPGKR